MSVVIQSDNLRLEILDVMDALVSCGEDFELPSPADNFTRFRRDLGDNKFTLLVCGEAKRGKSSFVNALLGRQLLPTDQEVATCQACRIVAAEEEQFRVRYEDGSVLKIEAEDLPRFVSETGKVNDDGPFRPDSLISWIECDVPAAFLPNNVNLIDTPGVGSLIEQHTLVTARFLPAADAVIFVLDSFTPITELECELLTNILATTPDVFFVQTKTDCVSSEDWNELKKRNEAILASKFGNQLDDPTIWPVSSELLFKSVEGGEKGALYLEHSGHADLNVALHAFLDRVTNLRRNSIALAMLDRLHRRGAQLLLSREKSLSDLSRKHVAETEERAQAALGQFRSHWGPNGFKVTQLQKKIASEIETHQKSFQHFLQPSGRAQNHFDQVISTLEAEKDLSDFEHNVSHEVGYVVLNQWQQTQESVAKRCRAHLLPLGEAVELPVLPRDSNDERTEVAADSPGDSMGLWDQIKGTVREGFIENILFAKAYALSGFLFPPAVPVLATIQALSTWRNWNAFQTRRVQQRKQELRRRVVDLLQEFQSTFHHSDLKTGPGQASEYFDRIRECLTTSIAKVVEKKLVDSRSELERFRQAAALTKTERETELAVLHKQRRHWNKLGKRIAAASLRHSGLRNRLRQLSVLNETCEA